MTKQQSMARVFYNPLYESIIIAGVSCILSKVPLERFMAPLLKGQFVIHCPHYSQAKELLKILDNFGFKWVQSQSLLMMDYYDIFRENTCYLLNVSSSSRLVYFGKLALFEEDEYNVISLEDFKKLIKEKPKCLKKN